jgi:glycosyltransferase involved in cell wall biosynthesis
MLVKSSPDARRRPRPGVPVRIALVHSFHGGAGHGSINETVRTQASALRRIGCEVSVVGAGADEGPRRLLHAVRTGVEVALGLKRCPDQELRRLQPHVVHVHSLFPTFASGWLRHWPGPLITTVHGSRPTSVSAVAAMPLGTTSWRGTAKDLLLSRADRIAVPSQLSWDLYRRAGIPVDRLALVPDFVPAPPAAGPVPDSAGRWAYVGNLSQGKGVVELLRRWPRTEPLDIVGEGELSHECRRVAPPSVRFVGALAQEEIRRRLPWWMGLVCPSQSFDTAPLVYPDAMAAGLPVVAWAGSPAAYAVRVHETGAVVGPCDRLGPILTMTRHQRPSLRERCREVYQAEFSEERWAQRILHVYRQAAQRRVALQIGSGRG